MALKSLYFLIQEGVIQRVRVGAVLRWQRNRTGRSLSPSQIQQKNISMLSKFHKQLLNAVRGQQALRKAAQRLRKEVGRELHAEKGILRREVSKHQETFSQLSLWQALEAQRAT